MPQDEFAERPEVLPAVNDGQEVVAGELAGLAGKAYRAVGEQDLGFADAAGVDDDLARRGARSCDRGGKVNLRPSKFYCALALHPDCWCCIC